MDFRIADSFQDSLARLTADEQKAVKTTAFDLQLDPAGAGKHSPGLQFHRLDRVRDKRFWSVRINRDVRLIVHRTDASLLLCYVDHHDKAYEWAERRKLEVHPTTGAAQFVEIRETIKEIVVPVHVAVEQSSAVARLVGPTATLADVADEELLGYGVPAEWIPDVKAAAGDELLAVVDHLPAEAAEAVLELATGGRPDPAPVAAEAADPFEHPDAQRRFRIVTGVEELRRALDHSWEKWIVFLHPDQRQWVERDFTGPARVGGSAGTGKTIVALHRAAYLARSHPDARVLLTTFSETLASALRSLLRRLIANEPVLGERIDVRSLDQLGVRLHEARVGPVAPAERTEVVDLLRTAAAEVPDHRFSLPFLVAEWEEVVDAWQLESWEEYRDVARLGRKTRLPESRRRLLWRIFEQVLAELGRRGRVTRAQLFKALTSALKSGGRPAYDFAVVDEAQDIGVPHLRFFAALGGERPNALFFAGDLGQRIFQQPFSWKSLGVDIRGRSRTLRVNYRTSHQIRSHADRLLGPVVTDVDGEAEDRRGTVSVFNGPPPMIRVLPDAAAEIALVRDWLTECVGNGVLPHEVGVFVRSDAEIQRAREAVGAAGMEARVLDEHVETARERVSIGTMHLAKGLEFRAVAVMACDDEVIPSQQRIETVGDAGDLSEVYETERHLLYVACTRARDRLLVTGTQPGSEFLDDLTARAVRTAP